jgi:hypothetical protein
MLPPNDARYPQPGYAPIALLARARDKGKVLGERENPAAIGKGFLGNTHFASGCVGFASRGRPKSEERC